MLKNIDVKSFKECIGIVNIIDIRSIEKYNSSHIENSINVPIDVLLINPSKYLSKKEEYYIYCQHGKTSIRACMILCKLGYRVINLLGGYEAWLLN